MPFDIKKNKICKCMENTNLWWYVKKHTDKTKQLDRTTEINILGTTTSAYRAIKYGINA